MSFVRSSESENILLHVKGILLEVETVHRFFWNAEVRRGRVRTGFFLRNISVQRSLQLNVNTRWLSPSVAIKDVFNFVTEHKPKVDDSVMAESHTDYGMHVV